MVFSILRPFLCFPAMGQKRLENRRFLKYTWQERNFSVIMCEAGKMRVWPINRQQKKRGRGSAPGVEKSARVWRWITARKRCIVFLLFLFLLPNALMLASELLYPANDTFRNWQAFYAQEKDSIDLLIVGGSHAYSSFDLDILDEALDQKAFILASNSQTVTQTYYNVLEALNYQSPKTILLETFGINENNNWRYDPPGSENYDKDWKKESNIDGMRFGLAKLKAIGAQYVRENWAYAFFRIARCHQNWKEPAQILSNLEFMRHQASTFQSFRPSKSAMTEEVVQQYADMPQSDDVFVASEENVRHFHMLAALCREKGIRLVLVMAPMYDGYIQKINYASRYEAIRQLAESENLEYIDCNMCYAELGLEARDFENAVYSYLHMNARGAAKVTAYVAERIRK